MKESDLVNEEFETRDYIKSLSLYEARTLFKYRCSMTQYVKMNFKNDKDYANNLWKCEKCSYMDTNSNLLWCDHYRDLRHNKDLSNNKDLCKYLHEILMARTSDDLKNNK